MRSIFLSLVLLLPALGSAARLGDLDVRSYLGETFAADLVVSREPGEDLRDHTFGIGDATDYGRLQLPRPAAADWIILAEPRLEQGVWRVAMSSRLPIEDLVLDLVVVMAEPGGVQSRHYPVLLDFPSAIEMPEQEPQVEPEPPVARRPARTDVMPTLPAPVEETPAPAAEEPTGTSYRVRRGDTLYGISRRYTGERSLDEVADLLFNANPDAFVNGNRNRLLAGVTMTVPQQLARNENDLARLPEIPPPVEKPITAPGRASEADRVRLRAPPGPEEIAQSLADWLDADALTLAAQQETVDRDLAYARTEIETYRQQNENLRERIATLEQRIGDLQRLMELREAEAADQARAAAEPGITPADTASQAEPDLRPGLDAPVDQPPQAESQDRAWLPYLLGAIALIAVAVTFFVRARNRRLARARRRAAGRRQDTFLPDGL
ncbi:MAG: hypothetical protein R3200_00150 [Xanthomonadales bacterium]|nr:hypothetical protein [Xanthomonadales bacterium]